MYNSFDRFGQLALATGMDTALVTWARQAAVDLTAIPGVENILRTGVTKATRAGARGERVRDALQAGGDAAASAINRLFGASGARIEVNKIIDAGDDVIMVGDKAYTAKVLNRIFVEEGAASAFDNTQLRSIIQNRRNAGGLGPLDPTIASDVAESISVRERYGAAVTLLEQGVEPRKAIQFVNKAYYDYATSVAKQEGTQTASGLILQALDPYLAYTKNATRQIFDSLFTPEAAYRMSIIRRVMDQGPAMLTEELYSRETDAYGVDVDALPDSVRQDYFTMKDVLLDKYKGDVPDDVKRAVRTVVSGGFETYEDGRLRQLSGEGPLRAFAKSSGLHDLRRAVPPRPDKSRQRTWMRGRPTIGITPDMESKAVQDYMNSQPTGERSTIAFVLPEDTIHMGMKRMMFTLLTGAAVYDATTGGDMTGGDIARFAGEYFSPERSPVLGPALGSATGAKAQTRRISKTLAKSIEHHFPGVHIERTTYGAGPSATTVHKLPPGPAWSYMFLMSGLKDVDATLQRIEGSPQLTALERQGMLMRAISTATGIPVVESQRTRTAELDTRDALRTMKQK